MADPIKSKVTLRDVAAAVGVSRATASRALRESPMISSAIRSKVKAAAKKLGYTPDPEAQRLMSYLRSSRESRFESTLGILNAYEEPASIFDDSYTKALLRGAGQRAAQLGFSVDMLNLREEGMSPRRQDQIIKARGIRGLLIPPEPEALFNADLDWSRVAVVATTTTAKPLRLHRALPHNYHNVHLLIDHALACGYKRIGLVHWPLLEERMMQATSAVYALEGYLRKSFQPVPVFEWKWQPPEKLAVALERWVHKSRVDCILAFDTFALDALAAVGIHAPGDIGYVSYGGAPASVSQINQNPQTVGAAAVDLLSAQVIRGECGFPASPKTLLIEGKFVQGSTTVKPA